MSRDASQSATSLQIARRLLAREVERGSEPEPQAAGAALQRACSRAFENLRDSMGEDGCTALLARAFSRAEGDHPALRSVRRLKEGAIRPDGVAASVEEHGIPAVTAAIEALLAALVDILARLIGEDMAIRIIDHDEARPRTFGGTYAP